jgi:hypothetical protein
MTKLAHISEDASLVLVAELIIQLERQREADGQPSLIEDLKGAIARAWVEDAEASPRLRLGMADAQLVLEWVQDRLAPDDLHFGDLVARQPKLKL